MNDNHTTGLSQDMAACGLQNLPQPPQIALPPGLPPPSPTHSIPQTQTKAQHHTFDLHTQLTELLEQEILDFREVIQAKNVNGQLILTTQPLQTLTSGRPQQR